MLNPTLQLSEYVSPEARVVYAVLPPHAQASFTSVTPQGSIGVSFTGHRRAAREYSAGPVVQKDICPGAAFLTMSSSLLWLDVAEPADALEFHYAPSYFTRALKNHETTPSIELPTVGGTRDPIIWGIAAMFRAHLRSGRPLSDVRASELLTTLSSHVLQEYGALTNKDRGPGKLDVIRLRRVDEYMDSALSETLTIPQLAAAAALSSFHFARIFRATTGLSPHQYVTAKRMERARQVIGARKISTLDLANLVGFTHVAHFRAAFFKFFGTTPARYQLDLNQRITKARRAHFQDRM